MGIKHSVKKTGPDTSTVNIISKSYLSLIQNTSQGETVDQLMSVDCNSSYCSECTSKYNITTDKQILDTCISICKNADPDCMPCINTGTSDCVTECRNLSWLESPCISCLKTLSDFFEKSDEKKTPLWIRDQCKGFCKCNTSDIDIQGKYKVNFSNLQDSTSEDTFTNTVTNEVNSTSSSSGSGIISSTSVTTIQNIQEIYNHMKKSSFQDSVQNIMTAQNIMVKSPSNLYYVDLNAAITAVSQVIQDDSELSKSVSELETNIMSMTTQVTSAGLSQVILWIIQIVFIIAMVMILYYMMQAIINIYNIEIQL